MCLVPDGDEYELDMSIWIRCIENINAQINGKGNLEADSGGMYSLVTRKLNQHSQHKSPNTGGAAACGK